MIAFANRNQRLRFDGLALAADRVCHLNFVLIARQQIEGGFDRAAGRPNRLVRVKQRDFHLFDHRVSDCAAGKIGDIHQHFPKPDNFDDFLAIADDNLFFGANIMPAVGEIKKIRPFRQSDGFDAFPLHVGIFHLLPHHDRLPLIIRERERQQ